MTQINNPKYNGRHRVYREELYLGPARKNVAGLRATLTDHDDGFFVIREGERMAYVHAGSGPVSETSGKSQLTLEIAEGGINHLASGKEFVFKLGGDNVKVYDIVDHFSRDEGRVVRIDFSISAGLQSLILGRRILMMRDRTGSLFETMKDHLREKIPVSETLYRALRTKPK